MIRKKGASYIGFSCQ